MRKDELIQSHTDYIASHPEIREVLNDFVSSVLLHKPVSCLIWHFQNDVFVYAKEYFHPFNPKPLKYKPLIIVGPSGVGKNTLIKPILDKYGALFEKKKSYTTRERRPGESELKQQQFYFVNKDEFERMGKNKEFIEQHQRLAGMYATSRKELERI